MTFSDVLDVNFWLSLLLLSDLRMKHQRMPSSCLYLLCQRSEEVKISTLTVYVSNMDILLLHLFAEWFNFIAFYSGKDLTGKII